LEARLFDGDTTAGPVPIFFSEDTEAASEAARANPIKAHHDLQRIMKVFIMPELINLEEAKLLVKKPRYNVTTTNDLDLIH
jgi:uncharacterized protein YccT (UPF0319 family)